MFDNYMFEHVVRLTRKAAGASFAALCITSETPCFITDGEYDAFLKPGQDLPAATPMVITDTRASTTAFPVKVLETWVRSFAISPITGPSAESGYLLLASDQPVANDTWLTELQSATYIIEDHLDRDIEQLRIDQMAALLRQNQTELHETQTRLEIANKELEQFAYIAAHELVAPLRAVAIYAEVLDDVAQRADGDIGQTAQACAVSIRDGVSLMNQQVQYLLELSQGQADPTAVEAIDLRDVVSNVLDTLAPTLEEAAAVINVGELAIVHGKLVPLQSVFANLFSNAVRYRDPTRELVLDIRAEDAEDDVIITVTDTGPGVKDADSQRIFHLFERASADPAGAGIGLALSRRIVESFGGEMGVRPAESVGATFWMKFPRLTP